MAKTMRRASNEYANAGQPSDELTQMVELLQQANGGKKPKRTQRQQKSWVQKKKEEAAKAAKAKAKAKGNAAWASTRGEVRSSVHRNRAQLAPWLLSAPFYAAGEAALLASQQPDATSAAVAGVAAAVTGTGTVIGWRRKLRHRVPERFTRRVQRGLACGCAWAASMPMLAPELGEPTMWAAALSGTVALSARWWQQHRPGYPDGPEQPANDALGVAWAQNLVETFNERCTAKGAPVPDGELRHYDDTSTGSVFRLQLDADAGVLADSLDSRKGKISLLLGIMSGQISFTPDKADPAVVWMRVTSTAPDNVYTGPRILRNGQPCQSRSEIGPNDDVDIVIGPFQDGEGEQTFRVIKGGSVQGGFLLGDKGSGKSMLMEQLAIGLRWLGIFILYFDGQGGSSSPTLKATADWPETDVAEGPDRVFRAIKKMLHMRQGELAGDDEHDGKYVYDPARPPVIVFVDECHVLFNRTNPITGNTYGVDLGEADRMWRKAGMSLIGASQDCDLNTFGGNGSDVLRSGMLGGNLLVMHYMSKAHTGLLPGNAIPPGGVPDDGGYGQAPLGARPQVVWRAQKADNAREWLESLPAATLDRRTERAAGVAYANRHEQARVNADRAKQNLADMDNMADEELEARLNAELFGDSSSKATPSSGDSSAGGSTSTSATVIRMPGATDTPSDTSHAENTLTERQVDMLDLLASHPLSTQQIADHYGVSVQRIRDDIRRLGEGRLAQVDRGVYRAKQPARS